MMHHADDIDFSICAKKIPEHILMAVQHGQALCDARKCICDKGLGYNWSQ